MKKNKMKKRVKEYMREQCAKFGIEIPADASKKQLDAAFKKCYKDAAYIRTENGIEFIPTDKPTAEYTVPITVIEHITLRAESQEVAQEWANEHEC